MRTFEKVAPLRGYLRGLRLEGKTVGFVPTMGALHDGHLALVKRARNECDVVVVSIFVNPTQFGPNEDFAAYPRDLAGDRKLIANVGVDAAFVPEVDQIYTEGAQTIVEVSELTRTLEGAIRPTHFRGVATVVTKLFNIVQPNSAYFGHKDYQQLIVIERMTRDLMLPIEIAAVATVREPDGLAMSSRNRYLSPDERAAATVLYRALKCAGESIAEGEQSPTVEREIENIVRSQPLAIMEYGVVVNAETLAPMERIETLPVLVALAVRVGRTRLIDNALVGPGGEWLVRQRSRPH